ncbi:hypothetical protein C8Q73DRAFT_838699 [Cubamyces lactineus]|nr:hypothetical protein C8Q73DRAFT_838699 [Cubamyces lactineus]
MTTIEQRSNDHTPTGFSALPVELIDLIFQHAFEDVGTASACTLVSRDWRELALPHFFSSVSVGRRTAFEDLRDFLDTHPHIARCIRTLKLKQTSDCTSRGSLTAVSLDRLGSMRAFGELVHTIAEKLQHLALPFALRHLVKASEDKPEHWRELNLHECHNLRSFTLSVYPPMLRTLATARGSSLRQDVPLSTICIAILSHLSPTLRTFTLAIRDQVAPAHIRHRKMGLEALDEALLSKERFPSLELVVVTLRQRYHPEAPIDECERAVREVMPKCDRRGILEVSKDLTEVD